MSAASHVDDARHELFLALVAATKLGGGKDSVDLIVTADRALEDVRRSLEALDRAASEVAP